MLSKAKSLTNQARDAIMEIVMESEFMTKLPSESELSAQLGISRNTVREAIKMLEHEGVIISRHGVGTFVINTGDGLKFNITNLNSTTDIITSQGYKPGSIPVLLDIRPASSNIAHKLRIASGDSLIYFERVRTADGQPVILVDDYLPYEQSIYEALSGDAPQSLFAVLARSGLTVSFSKCSLDSEISNQRQMTYLELDKPQAMLVLRQTHYSSTGEPVLYSDSYFLTDKLELNLIRRH